MSSRADKSDLVIQAVLRAEIRDLQFRHTAEIALLRATDALILNGPPHGLPALADQVAMLLQGALCDAEWHLQSYPNVAESGMYAAEHYVRAVAFEGRDPRPQFDSLACYLANPDAAEAIWPALMHFMHSGKAEGRPPA